MISKCQCQNCGGNVEFEASEFELSGETSHRNLGQMVDCPHCNKPTQIYMNKAEFIAPPAMTPPAPEMFASLEPCGYCQERISRAAVFCPHCGGFKSIPFRLVLQAVFYFMAASAFAAGFIALVDYLIQLVSGL
jgi:ssDNA-binding Zn-finger/Zn-ribbon topoisomerase 1